MERKGYRTFYKKAVRGWVPGVKGWLFLRILVTVY
jgi:hypothetical protein